MHITSIELDHWRRFVLTGTTHLKAQFTTPLQIVIGTNGSGKSSLLEQLTIWPRLSADFEKGGSGALEFVHDNSCYRLAASFENGQRHYFSKDGVALNDWGTSVVQKDLIAQHFGITSNINSLLQNQEKFTRLSPMRRKEWFIELCEANYDYAIKVYNRCKERARDLQGAIKLAKQKLVAESDKLLKEDEEKRLTQQAQDLHDVLETLLEIRIPLDQDPSFYLERIVYDVQSVNKQKSVAQTLKKACSQIGYYSDSQLDTILNQLKVAHQTHTQLLQNCTQWHHKNEEHMALLEQTETKTIDALKAELDQLITAIDAIQKTTKVKLEHDAVVSQQSFEAAQDTLVDLLTKLKPNPERLYSSIKKSESQDLYNKKKKALESYASLATQAKVKMEHLLKHKETPDLKCPKCEHQFSALYNEAQFLHEKNNFEVASEECVKLQKEIEEVQVFMTDCTEYGAIFTGIIRLQQGAPLLRAYWDLYMPSERLYNEPGAALSAVSTIALDLNKQIELQLCIKEAKEKKELLDKISKLDTADLSSLKKMQADLSVQIEQHTSKLMMLNTRQQYFQMVRSRMGQIKSLQTTLETLETSITGHQDRFVEARRRVVFNQFVREIQSLLAQKVNLLQEAQAQHKVIKTLTQQIVDLEQEHIAFTTLVATLCPNSGLIAQGLYGFLNTFISEMNAVINDIWTYELTLGLPSTEDNLELSYNFPVTIRGEKGPKDCSACSEGQQDIIDFAFNLIARKYLGKQNYPLLLDELGRTFDVAHKDNLVMYLKKMMEESNCQIFMVSHDVKAYSSLPAEYMVLSPDNVVLPPVYNRHVKKK